MELATRAIWIIERNFAGDLTLNSIADACGVSPFHLAHAFGAATGRPVMSYVRGRRLTEAARKLVAGAPGILSVALESGYASHEAFTRAFKEQFGVTPDSVRRGVASQPLSFVEPLKPVERGEENLAEPEIVKAKAMSVVGLVERQDFGSPERIPAQWQRFMAMYGLIESKTNAIPLGVTCNLDESGTFEYVCGVEVARGAEAHRGLQKIAVPAQTYAVFPHVKHVSAIGNTYRAIWNTWLTDQGRIAANGPSLERHKPTFDPRTGEGGVDIWIPLVE